MRSAILVSMLMLAGAACGDGAGGSDDGANGSTNDDGGPGGTLGLTEGDDDGDGNGDGNGDANGDGGSVPDDDGGPASDTPGDDSSSATGEPTGDPGIHFVGRYDDADPNRVRLGWSGAGLTFRFDGTTASVRLDDAAGWWTVVVDGTVAPPLTTTPGEQSYPLATGLAPGIHEVELYRRTEGFFGETAVLGVDIDGELLAPAVPNRRIEVLGDSITCGYGDEGPNESCPFTADTENHYLTYAAIAARSLGAELSTVAWSGKGVIFNYGEDTNEPLPTLYSRTISTDAATTWTSDVSADAVVINLGTNDFSTEGDPSQGQFVDAYVALLTDVRSMHPEARIFCTVAPLLGGEDFTTVQGYIQEAIGQRADAGDTNLEWIDLSVEAMGFGCDWHPNLDTHAAMAPLLQAALSSALGW